MEYKTSLWRAWYPVVYQLTGFLVAVSSAHFYDARIKLPLISVGAALYLFGLFYRKRAK